ncbi:MAG: NAD(P) transhydrogenase subunit alpha [Saprospiraceae bacterium]
MKFAVFKEETDRRVAIVPSTVPKFKGLGLEVILETGAGQEALFSDEDYIAEGAQVMSRAELLKVAEVAISIHPLSDETLKALPANTLVISQFQPFVDEEVVGKLRGMGLRAFSMDMIPRTTLAQAMDVLSSMASIAGYRAVLEAATRIPRYFPMMITAAGSIKPAKVLVLGAGVAGLQAIATAKRLGAQVEAFDTRSAAKEEVQSLGARFVEVPGAVEDKGAGGYGVAQSEEFLKRQREEVQSRAMKADVIITTAQVRGRKAPILVPKETVEKMRQGSIIVDLASSTGGNCELTQDLKVINHNGVYIQGNSSLASLMPQDASFLYSNNVFNFAKVWAKDGQLVLDMGNEIIASALITAEMTK